MSRLPALVVTVFALVASGCLGGGRRVQRPRRRVRRADRVDSDRGVAWVGRDARRRCESRSGRDTSQECADRPDCQKPDRRGVHQPSHDRQAREVQPETGTGLVHADGPVQLPAPTAPHSGPREGRPGRSGSIHRSDQVVVARMGVSMRRISAAPVAWRRGHPYVRDRRLVVGW
jgi:hypothetical protein